MGRHIEKRISALRYIEWFLQPNFTHAWLSAAYLLTKQSKTKISFYSRSIFRLTTGLALDSRLYKRTKLIPTKLSVCQKHVSRSGIHVLMFNFVSFSFCIVLFFSVFPWPKHQTQNQRKGQGMPSRGFTNTPTLFCPLFCFISYVWLGYCIGFFLCSYFSFFFFVCLLFFFLLCFVLSPFSCLFYFVCLFSYSTFDWFVSYYSCVRF